MRFKASATLEFPLAAPETIRTEVVATKPQTAAHRTVRELLRTHPRRKWASLVVLLEKVDPEEPPS